MKTDHSAASDDRKKSQSAAATPVGPRLPYLHFTGEKSALDSLEESFSSSLKERASPNLSAQALRLWLGSLSDAECAELEAAARKRHLSFSYENA